MSFPDTHQDVVVFAANALRKLIQQEDLKAEEIDRIYVGTESSFDASKPIASYLTQVLEASVYAAGALENCDVVDLTFACIGGVDALQNSLDFIRANPGKKAIVVCSDIAKYDLASTGEYTQGAGAIAMLISEDPRIISFDQDWTVSTSGVFDFFKPKRTIKKTALALKDNEPWHEVLETEISIHKDQPVFDGQYSNACYLERTMQSYLKLKAAKNVASQFFAESEGIIMHLPYCFQARRNFVNLYIEDSPLKEAFESSEDKTGFIKSTSKSEEYKALVASKILPSEVASGEIGNLYTGSIFMGFLSTLSHFVEEQRKLESQQLLFIAYGSGSKSKSFVGHLEQGWEEKIAQVNLFAVLKQRQAITNANYLALHKKESQHSILAPSNEYVLDYIEEQDLNLIGARYYKLV